MDDLRVRLIERLCRLPEGRLADAEVMFISLERGAAGISRQLTTNASQALAHHKDWPHAPVHRLSEQGTYIVTASTLHKEHFFRDEEKLTLLENKLLFLAMQHEVTLEAWAVFSNHYHFVAHTTGADNQIGNLIARLHYDSAEEINRRDGSAGRAVWFNFWDTKLTFEKS